MIKCSKCGNPVSDKDAFCVHCGAPIVVPASQPAVQQTESPQPASAPAPAPQKPAKKVNINTILLGAILVLLVAGGVTYLIINKPDSPRGIPEGIGSYEGSTSTYSTEEIVYCNSYDGYLNIRSTPSSKGEKLGKFKNGPEGAIKLSESGSWVEIDYNGVVGYVSKKHVVTYPTKAVTVDVDEKWLTGPWYPSHRNFAYIIFNNGTYTVQYEYGTLAYGTYHLEGDEIIFSATMLSNQGYDVGSYERHKITVSPKRIGPLTKRSFIKEDDRWKHYGELVWTWAEYSELKKRTKENVRL